MSSNDASTPTTQPVRVRIAPSPTGFFHVGTARTALYNHYFAEHARVGGERGANFVLRIEDTDAERHQEEAIDGIKRGLDWLDIPWVGEPERDGQPYRQSLRAELYRDGAQKLVDSGLAYFCDMSSEQITERAKAEGRTGYGGWSRDRNLGPGPDHVLRFRVPEGKTTVNDMVRGEVVFDNANIEDFVIQRPDGSSLFILAVTIDDATMDITHVFRGEEHLANTPKQQLLWSALGYGQLPMFGHLPVLVNEKRQKLSKRRDKVAMEQYQAEGYLPEAMANYLSLLGWAPSDDRETLTRQEFIDEFRMEEVKSAPAFFDLVKMRDVNGKYVRALTPQVFQQVTQPYLPAGVTWPRVEAMVPLVQERVELLSDVTTMVDFFAAPDHDIAALHDTDETLAAWTTDLAKLSATETTRPLLADVIVRFADGEFTADSTKAIVQEVGEAHGLKLGKAQAPVRLAVTGRRVGPPLFEAIEILGRDSVLVRLNAFDALLRPAKD